MCVRALLPDNGIFLFFLSLSAGNLSGSSAFARAACAGHLLYVSSVCAPFPCVGDSINLFSHHVNRFILVKTNLPFRQPVARRHHRADSCTAGAFHAAACAARSSMFILQSSFFDES